MKNLISVSLLFTLGALSAFGPLTIDLYLPAFVDIAKDLNVQTAQIQYTLTSFLAGLAIGQLIYGPISDKFGRKKPLLFGVIVFIISSIAIYYTQDLHTLIILRFIQALGSCVGMVITRAIVRDMFDQKDSAKVFSLIILIMGVAPIIAPLLGSQILLYSNWRAIFLFLAIFGVFTLIGSIFKIKETLKEPTSIKSGFKNYYRLFFDRQFVFSAIISGTISAAMFSYISGSAFVFLNIYKFNSLTYPLAFGINALGFIIASQINRKLLNHFSLDTILTFGIFMIFISSILMNISIYLDIGYLPFTICLFLSISSIGFILPNIAAKALEFQHKRAAVASALMGFLQFFVSSFGSILVTLFANETPWPLSLTFLLFSLLSLLIFYFGLIRSRNTSAG